MQAGTRSQVKEKIRKGLVCVNGQVIKKPEIKLDEKIDEVTLEGRIIGYDNSFYYMLNKPQGVISATEDGRQATLSVSYTHLDVTEVF